MGYDIKDNKYVLSKDEQLKRMTIYYNKLLPLDTNKDDLEKLSHQLEKYNFKDSLVFISSKDIYKSVFYLGLRSLGKKVQYEVMNAYRLIDIYLGNDPLYKSVSAIECKYLLIYLGYNEFENKRQGDIIDQVMSLRKTEGKYTWLFYRGTKSAYSNYKIKCSNVYSLEIEKKRGDVF